MKHTHLYRQPKPIGHNAKRRRKMHERNYGPRADALREGQCEVAAKHFEDQAGPSWHIRNLVAGGIPPERLACSEGRHAAHTSPRGMGGCNSSDREQVCLCAHHDLQAGERGTTERKVFEKLYDLDLHALAEQRALEFDGRGLA